jgi:hypothetical protein
MFENFKKELRLLLNEIFNYYEEYKDESFDSIWFEEHENEVRWVEFGFEEDFPSVIKIKKIAEDVIIQLANQKGYIAITQGING